MRSLGNRRAARAVGAATVAVIALAGCSAGQVAETAMLQSPISGVNTQSPDGGVLIRNLQVVYNNPGGYPAGGTAPVGVSLFNTTEQPVTVVVSSAPVTGAQPQDGIVSADQVGLLSAAAASPSANPEPSGSRPSTDPNPSATEVIDPSGAPTTPAAGSTTAAGSTPTPTGAPVQPARITIPALGNATFLPQADKALQAVNLSGKLVPGTALNLVFEVSTSSEPLTLQAPFEVPLSPASRLPTTPPNENLGEE